MLGFWEVLSGDATSDVGEDELESVLDKYVASMARCTLQRHIHMLASLHSLPGSSFAVYGDGSSYRALDSSIPTHEMLDVSVRSR